MTPEKDIKPVGDNPVENKPVGDKPVNSEPLIRRFPSGLMVRSGNNFCFLPFDFERKNNPLSENGKVEKSD